MPHRRPAHLARTNEHEARQADAQRLGALNERLLSDDTGEHHVDSVLPARVCAHARAQPCHELLLC